MHPGWKHSDGYNVAGFYLNSDSTIDTGWSLGARLTMPALNIYRNVKKIDEAKAVFDKSTFESETLKNKIYLQVQQAHSVFEEAQKSVPVSKVALEEAKENYDITQGRYKVGFGNHIELKDADFFYVNAKLAYFKSLYDYNLAIAALEKFVGQKLDLNPSAQK